MSFVAEHNFSLKKSGSSANFPRAHSPKIMRCCRSFGLHTKFTLLDIKPPTRLSRVRTEENIAAVSACSNDDHQLSIRRRSQQFDRCYSTTCKILRKDLAGKPFKIQLVLPKSIIFVEWAFGKLAEDPLFFSEKLCSATMLINVFFFLFYCRFWSED